MEKLSTKVAFIVLPVILTGTSLFSQAGEMIERSTRIAYDRQPSFISISEFTGGPGISMTDVPYAKYYAGFTSLAGYRFTGNIVVGAGGGLHFHNEGTFVPLFLDARFSPNAGYFVPYFSAAGGLAYNLSDPDNRTWLFLNPSLGVRWLLAHRKSMSFSAGLMTLSGSVNRNSFINFRLGFEFKGR